jgi:hypothetical protein
LEIEIFKKKKIIETLIFFFINYKMHMISQITSYKNHKGKITLKGATQMGGHSLKLHFYSFDQSPLAHNNLDH